MTLRSFSVSCAANNFSSHPEPHVDKHGAVQRPPLINLTRRQLITGTGLALACPWCLPSSAAEAISSSEYRYVTSDAAVWSGTCATGKSQSPVDLPVSMDLSNATFTSAYGPFKPKYPRFIKAACKNAGHGTPQVEIPADAEAFCMLGETPLRLLQFHFHAPSEHSLNGQHAPLEVHLVHKNEATGEIVVFAALAAVREKANPCLAAALASAPLESGSTLPMKSAISLQALLPKPRSTGGDRPYVSYKGSLTTPPCTEGVTWVVFLDPVGVSAEQVVQFEFFAGGGKTLGFNAREKKPLGKRDLLYSL